VLACTPACFKIRGFRASRPRFHVTHAPKPYARLPATRRESGQPIDHASISAPDNWRRSTERRDSKLTDPRRFVTHCSRVANYGFRITTLVLSRPIICIARTLHAFSLESFLVTPFSCNILVSVLLYYTRFVYCNVLVSVLLYYTRSVHCNVLVSVLLDRTRSVHCNALVSVLLCYTRSVHYTVFRLSICDLCPSRVLSFL